MRRLALEADCPLSNCVLSRSGRFCLTCGRALETDVPAPEIIAEALAYARANNIDIDPETANYWIYLMHDAEIVNPDEPGRRNGGISFYGAPRQTTKRASD